jgi:hypothetical protein
MIVPRVCLVALVLTLAVVVVGAAAAAAAGTAETSSEQRRRQVRSLLKRLNKEPVASIQVLLVIL